jgi:hypothetical protein
MDSLKDFCGQEPDCNIRCHSHRSSWSLCTRAHSNAGPSINLWRLKRNWPQSWLNAMYQVWQSVFAKSEAMRLLPVQPVVLVRH